MLICVDGLLMALKEKPVDTRLPVEIRPATQSSGEIDPVSSGPLLSRARAWFHPTGNEPVDDLNIPWRVHYFIIMISAWNLSATPLLISLTKDGHELAHPVVRAMCFYGLAMVPLYYALAKRWGYRFNVIFFNVVTLQGTISIFISAQFLDELRAPMIASFLLGPVGAAYYLKPKMAIPQIVLTTVLLAAYLPTILGGQDAFLRGTSLAIVAAGGSMTLLALRRHLIRVSKLNRRLSESDALTGAANVRRMHNELDAAILSHDAGGEAFALVAIDLDDFKQANDLFSHSVGDEVLVRSVEAIRDSVHDEDLVVRRGGDEFVVLIPESATKQLDEVVVEIGGRIAHARRQVCAEVIPTATVAYVEHRRDETAKELIARVDHALHEIKVNAPSTRRGTASRADVARIVENVVELHPYASKQNSILRSAVAQGSQAAENSTEDPVNGSLKIAWRIAAMTTVAFSSTMIGLGAFTDTTIVFTPFLLVMSAASIFLLAPAFWWMSNRGSTSMAMRHLLAIVTIAMITVGCLTVGEAATSGVEMYLMTLLIICAVMPMRTAFYYSGLIWGLYAAFLAAHGIDFLQIRLSTTMTNVMLLAGVLMVTRTSTIKAAQLNAELASIDALTGLPNLRRLREHLENEIRRGETHGAGFALIMLDLDDFKSVNDTLGHSVGDRTLTDVSNAIQAAARHSEMPARRGGDEFALVLTDTDDAGAEAVAKRVGDVIEQTRMESCPSVAPTASIAWAVWKQGESVDDLLVRVDQELHTKKEISHLARGYVTGVSQAG